mgnify:CR=1 FL=1
MTSLEKYLREYRKYITGLIDSNQDVDYERIIAYHEKQIEFFQHERLIHLIVTTLFAILFFASVLVVVFIQSLAIILLSVMLLIMNIAYIKHYYFLENEVQKLYQDFNKLYEKQYGITYKPTEK